MENKLYSKTVRQASESPSHEEPVIVHVTREPNAIVVWLVYGDQFPAPVPLAVFSAYKPDEAIELGVALGKRPPASLIGAALNILKAQELAWWDR